jgi:hypothetical protein
VPGRVRCTIVAGTLAFAAGPQAASQAGAGRG